MANAIGGSRLGEHAVYPGTFDPATPGHLDVIERARHLFARVTVLVAVNGYKQPSGTPSDRAVRLRRQLPADWDNVSVAAWAGLTVAFCRQHGAGVIIRGVRNRSDLPWASPRCSCPRSPGWRPCRRHCCAGSALSPQFTRAEGLPPGDPY